MTTPAAIAVFEFDSIAVGMLAADAMVKKAPLDTFRIGTVHPGRYLVLIGGPVAAVDEARADGRRLGGDAIADEIFLPDVHAQVFAAVAGQRRDDAGDALGIIETATMPAVVAAADRAIKTAPITIVEVRLGDGLGGKGLTLLTGVLHDVQAAVDAGMAAAERSNGPVRQAVIGLQHGDLRGRLRDATRFFAGPAS